MLRLKCTVQLYFPNVTIEAALCFDSPLLLNINLIIYGHMMAIWLGNPLSSFKGELHRFYTSMSVYSSWKTLLHTWKKLCEIALIIKKKSRKSAGVMKVRKKWVYQTPGACISTF